MNPSSHLIRVFDNFYDAPDYLRAEALAARYVNHSTEDGSAFGSSTLLAFVPCNMEDRVCAAFGFERVTLGPAWEGTGCFYHTLAVGEAREEFRVHRDDDIEPGVPHFALLIYMTPNAPPECGTGIYRHKEMGAWRQVSEADAIRLGKTVDEVEGILDRDDCNKSKWDLIGYADNVYNRAVVYPAHWLHSGTKYFGDSVANGRLYHMFFISGWPDVFAGTEEEVDKLFAAGKGAKFAHV